MELWRLKELSIWEEDAIFNVQSKITPSYHLVVEINEQCVSMEIDTTAAVLIMSKVRFAGLPLAKPTLSLHTYTAERMVVLGAASVHVRYGI